jgi:hypothetical protein
MGINKRIVGLVATLFAILLFIGNGDTAQAAPRIDATPMKPVVDNFFKLLARQGNIPVSSTFAWNSNYRKDWDVATTFMHPIADKSYIITLADGQIAFRTPTMQPPLMLNGRRAYIDPAHANVGSFNQDGSIPTWDKDYMFQYRAWVTRQTLDLRSMLFDNELYERLFMSMLRKHRMLNADGTILKKHEALIDAMGLGFLFPISTIEETPEMIVGLLGTLPLEHDFDGLDISLLDAYVADIAANEKDMSLTGVEFLAHPAGTLIDRLLGLIQWLVVGSGLLAILAILVIRQAWKREKVH